MDRNELIRLVALAILGYKPLPEWYETIKAARYLGVAPWALDDGRNNITLLQWREYALVAQQAEAQTAKPGVKAIVNYYDNGMPAPPPQSRPVDADCYARQSLPMKRP